MNLNNVERPDRMSGTRLDNKTMKLLPCPICGKPARPYHEKATCSNKDCKMHFASPMLTVEEWNTRNGDVSAREKLERIHKVFKGYMDEGLERENLWVFCERGIEESDLTVADVFSTLPPLVEGASQVVFTYLHIGEYRDSTGLKQYLSESFSEKCVGSVEKVIQYLEGLRAFVRLDEPSVADVLPPTWESPNGIFFSGSRAMQEIDCEIEELRNKTHFSYDCA